MAIQEDTVVYIAFKLKNTNGDVLDEASKDAPLPFIAGREQIIPGLEAALLGKQDGDIVNIVIQPDDAFGNYDEAFIQGHPKICSMKLKGSPRAWTWKLKWKQKKVTR